MSEIHQYKRLSYSQVRKQYDAITSWKINKEEKDWIEKELKNAVDSANYKIVVLDDDPTGVQSIHHVSVFTDWSIKSIEKGFKSLNKMFFILTNSRGLTEEETTKLHKEVAHNTAVVAKKQGIPFLIINRSDSTLRGHFPLETEVLCKQLEEENNWIVDGEILIPFFEAGGRITIENVHYVKYEDELVPANETEFAKDKTFGYENSDLRQYVQEKTNERFQAKDVVTITLQELRGLKLKEIEEKLMQVNQFQKVIVNALEQEDLKVFTIVLYKALAKGKRFLFRTAADFVKAIAHIEDQPLLTKAQMIKSKSNFGGLIVIGSHTKKTTAQFNALKDIKGMYFLEMNTDLVLEGKLDQEVQRVVMQCDEMIEKGRCVVVYTKRQLLILENDTKEKALLRSVEISNAVQKVVGELRQKPSFIIAKGGITSSDIGVKALRVKEAMVLGQVQPGIPVWKTDEESKFPGIPYVIFPGNVGDESTLRNVVLELMEEEAYE